jgi:hypothetical protein
MVRRVTASPEHGWPTSPVERLWVQCFACHRPTGEVAFPAEIRAGGVRRVSVDRACFAHIQAAKGRGYQPPRGGPRIWMDRVAS